MHTLELQLEMSAQQRRTADKRMRMVWHIHNETVSYVRKRLHELSHDREYYLARQAYRKAKADAAAEAKRLGLDDDRKKDLISRAVKPYTERMNERVRSFGLTKSGLDAFAAPMQHRFSRHVSNHQAQKEAERVYASLQKYLYGSGKEIHFRKLRDFDTVSSKSANGAKYTDVLHPGSRQNPQRFAHQLNWNGMVCKVRVDTSDPYVMESLDADISYAEIRRRYFTDGWHYSVILYLKGDAPVKHPLGSGNIGLDPGVSAMTADCEDAVIMKELAPDCRRYEEAIALLQRRLDKDLRRDNPDNYDEDGRVKRGHHRWKYSNGARRLKRKLSMLYEKRTAYTICGHHQLINEILDHGNCVIAEAMDYQALAKRAKAPAERRETAEAVRKARHKVTAVRKFRRKKRFGKSVASRSPGLFLVMLKRDVERRGGAYIEVDTAACRASQYDHVSDSYHKVPLSQRSKVIGGAAVLRDPYSAFLLRHASEDGTIDRDGCIRDFEKFLVHQDDMMESAPKVHPACFGF